MIFLFIISGCYVALILIFIYGFGNIKEFKNVEENTNTLFSIIIPFRNESENLPQLLHSILQLNYPTDSFECILVNDDSTDNSVKTINDFDTSALSIRVIQNNRVSNSPKKDAINTAISKAKFDWIVTTDADCILPQNWLYDFSSFLQKHNSKMIAGPVAFKTDYSLLESFQSLDFMSLQGATVGGFGIGKPFLCNGANLAYQKEVFYELNGFEGNSNIASGDDIFLFEKFYKAYPKQVHFIKSKSAIVTTFPLKSWNELIHQRIRWAAKSSAYQLGIGKLVGFLVFLINLSLIIALFYWSRTTENIPAIVLVFLIKILVDSILLKQVKSFYFGNKRLSNFLFSAAIYPFFCVFIVLKSLFFKYNWKGREFKK